MKEGVQIGGRTYYFKEANDPAWQEVLLAWQDFGYDKFASPKDQMEWSIMEVLLDDEGQELRFVSTGYSENPSLPREVQAARRVLAAAQKARAWLVDFEVLSLEEEASFRIKRARRADALERHLCAFLSPTDAAIVADLYLARSMSDPTLSDEAEEEK